MTHNRTSPKILVILHLFYNDEWQLINKYLSTLSPYNFDLKITVTHGHTDDNILTQIKQQYPNCEFIHMPNIGFDVAPFIHVINQTDLSKYDLIYKLQSKDIKKHSRYIYGQVFRRKDWFLNLYRGIFGKFKTTRIINMFMRNPNLGLVAAKNLIINDPLHKRAFTHAVAQKYGIKINPIYHYIAGTCFVIRAQCMKPIQDLNLTLADFETPRPNHFSTAHAFERLICAIPEYNGWQIHGIRTRHNIHPIKLFKRSRRSSMKLLSDKRFTIDNDFFYKALEGRDIHKYEIVKIRLGDIQRSWIDGKIYNLTDVSPYTYLTDKINGAKIYQKYCDINYEQSGFEMSINRYNTLIKSIETSGFKEHSMPVIDKNNIIMDGQHRCCILLHKYGPDHVIKALKIHM